MFSLTGSLGLGLPGCGTGLVDGDTDGSTAGSLAGYPSIYSSEFPENFSRDGRSLSHGDEASFHSYSFHLGGNSLVMGAKNSYTVTVFI
jgi:hypothetical protein